jgi:ferredoxin
LRLPAGPASPLIRPPGSVPEDYFLRLCVRCGQCLRVCPTNILQPAGLDQGVERLWTPMANADWAGCDPLCNRCGQACPTGAIRSLPLDQKDAMRMGLAGVDEKVCLQCLGRSDCQTVGADGNVSLVCRDACVKAAYDAIIVDDDARPTPTVMAEQCVGCGNCQAACHELIVRKKRAQSRSAIQVQAGGKLEDRLLAGMPSRPGQPASTPSPPRGGPPTEPPYQIEPPTSTQPAGTQPASRPDDVPYILP